MNYVIGIDGGGTKTEAIAMREDGTLAGSYSAGAANPHVAGFDSALNTIGLILDFFVRDPDLTGDDLRFICLGIAGVDQMYERERIDAYVKEYGVQRKLEFGTYITHDAEIALMSALGTNHGMIAISGTGSIVYGLTPAQKKFRAGGWGHLLGDEGSGYSIGLETLRAVMRSYDGVYPETRLTGMIQQKLRLTHITELKDYVYHSDIKKTDIADFAMPCIQAADGGDEIARQIVVKAASDLAESTLALRTKSSYFLESPIAAAGSVFKFSRLFQHEFEERLRAADAKNRIVHSEEPPAAGAARLAHNLWKRMAGEQA